MAWFCPSPWDIFLTFNDEEDGLGLLFLCSFHNVDLLSRQQDRGGKAREGWQAGWWPEGLDGFSSLMRVSGSM